MPQQPPEKREQWTVDNVKGSDAGGYYYTLSAVGGRTIAGNGCDVPVTVKLSKRTKKGFRRCVCLTCKTADTCPHSKFVAEDIKRYGEPREVGTDGHATRGARAARGRARARGSEAPGIGNPRTMYFGQREDDGSGDDGFECPY